MPCELPGHGSWRYAGCLPDGQATGGDAEIAQGGVELADRALVPGRVQGLRPGAGGGAGGVGERLGGCGADTGWVSVGSDGDTAQFAVQTIRRWWATAGSAAYPGATKLLNS